MLVPVSFKEGAGPLRLESGSRGPPLLREILLGRVGKVNCPRFAFKEFARERFPIYRLIQNDETFEAIQGGENGWTQMLSPLDCLALVKRTGFREWEVTAP